MKNGRVPATPRELAGIVQKRPVAELALPGPFDYGLGPLTKDATGEHVGYAVIFSNDGLRITASFDRLGFAKFVADAKTLLEAGREEPAEA